MTENEFLKHAIEHGITVKKIAKKYVVSCPFHKEETPSCTVDFNEGHFLCLGCGKSGSIRSLVQGFERKHG